MVFGGAPQAFGLLLGFYLAGLAIGAHVGGILCMNVAGAKGKVPLAALSSALLLASLAGYGVVPVEAGLISRMPLGLLYFPVAIAAGLFGAVLPLASHSAIAADGRVGPRISYLYLANIVGAAAGTLVTGYWLLDAWPTRRIALALLFAGLGLVCVIILLTPVGVRTRLGTAGAVTLAASLALIVHPHLFDRLYERLLFQRADIHDRFADLVENRHGVVAVTHSSKVFGGGAYDGVISTDLVHDRNLLVRAFAGIGIHPAPRRVLMIGLATGAWAQVFANSPDVDDITVVEINPGYLSIIARYQPVRGLLSNHKVNIAIDDGRRWLVHHPEQTFDLIVQNTTEHWRANTTNLLSQEYLVLIREHLRPGGGFFYNTTWSQDAFKTAFTVFPYGLRVLNFAFVSDSPVRLDSTRWHQILSTYRIEGKLVLDASRVEDREKLDSLLSLPESIGAAPTLAGLETRESMLARLTKASVVTDDNMLPEWRALLLQP